VLGIFIPVNQKKSSYLSESTGFSQRKYFKHEQILHGKSSFLFKASARIAIVLALKHGRGVNRALYAL
jgi:hypothetical protein